MPDRLAQGCETRDQEAEQQPGDQRPDAAAQPVAVEVQQAVGDTGPARPWWASRNTGPAGRAPMPLTTTTTPSASRAAPSAATEAQEPMLTAIQREEQALSGGVVVDRGGHAGHLQGTPCRSARKLYSTTSTVEEDL
ncbi:hypothetical protein FM21_13395 [Streptomyces mutabilis]|uniref:Uncharacterized protein n=1 Tax=Streptomyces mutabilis TaxID=67332 RepID=A0A086N795_9ACTN|nr:hypothetical protein FM21_13395 [Streptomyces mutabilis]